MEYKITKKIISAFIVFLLPSVAWAQLNTFQGGTGTTSPSGILYGDKTIRLKTVGIGSGLQFSGGTLSATGSAGNWATTSSDYWISTYNKGYFFSTTSSDYWLTTKNTGNLTEGSNLYYTNARVQTYLDSISKGYFFSTTSADYWGSTKGYLTGNQSITLSGDVSGSGATSISTTLATVNSNTGTFGSAAAVPQFTVNGKGLITAASNVSISIPASQVTSGTFAGGLSSYTFNNNLQSLGSTTLQSFTFLTATGTAATTTNFAIASLASEPIYVNANGTVGTTTIGMGLSFGGTDGKTLSNSGVLSVSCTTITCSGTNPASFSISDGSVPISKLAASTISGIALGSNLAALTHGTTLSGTSYNGSAAVSDWGINLANGNVWTAASSTFTGGITMGTATTTSATTTNLTVSANHIIVGNQNGYVNATSSGAFNIASTTLDAMGKSFNIGTTTILVANLPWPITLIGFYCTASSTGTALVRISHDNGSATETSTCTSGGFTRTTTNNTFTQYEALNVQASSTAGTVSRITVSPAFIKTGE